MDEREKELVQKSLSGDGSAFEALVLPHRQSLLHLAYRMTGNMEEAMDIAQEALLRCFQYLKRFNPEKSFRNWLFQIVVNLSRDWKKKKAREQKYLQEFRPAEYEPLETGSYSSGFYSVKQPALEKNSDIKIDVNRCLNILSFKEREVFILRDLEGLDIRETARILGVSSISVRVHLSSARKKIRQALTEAAGNNLRPGEKK